MISRNLTKHTQSETLTYLQIFGRTQRRINHTRDRDTITLWGFGSQCFRDIQDKVFCTYFQQKLEEL